MGSAARTDPRGAGGNPSPYRDQKRAPGCRQRPPEETRGFHERQGEGVRGLCAIASPSLGACVRKPQLTATDTLNSLLTTTASITVA
jgi:hypothetical protein